jgi:hypothetical protein
LRPHTGAIYPEWSNAKNSAYWGGNETKKTETGRFLCFRWDWQILSPVPAWSFYSVPSI